MRFTLPGFAKTPAPMPDPVDRAAIAEEAAKQRAKELRQRRGRAATILTGPSGPAEDTPNVQRPTLLGM
jgi:hypothetical protein